MAAFTSKSTKHYGVRSISFPGRSHSTTLRMEEKLNNLRSWQGVLSSSNAEKLCTGLFGLAELYACIEDLLNLPFVRQALPHQGEAKMDNVLLDCSLKHLDLCSKTRDSILSMKQITRELQSAVRRSKGGELSINSNINAYIRSRKAMKKEMAKSHASLKQMDNMFRDFPHLEHINHLSGLLREVSLITTSIFHSLFLFLSPSLSKPKPSKWSLVSKLVRKGLTPSEEQVKSANELDNVDVAVSNLLLQNSRDEFEEERIQCAQVKLESLDAIFEDFEDGLECLFRSLIQARVSLLNMLSH